MRKSFVALLGAAAFIAATASANAQDTVKVGVILSLSGQFADAQELRVRPLPNVFIRQAFECDREFAVSFIPSFNQ